jgi:hypothetical protein
MFNNVSLSREKQQSLLAKVYLWMFVGLLITAFTAFKVSHSDAAMHATKNALLFIVIFKLVLVTVISWFIEKMHPVVAGILFLVYSVSTGFFLSFVLLAYTEASVASAFITTAGVFGLMSLYGVTTKRDLTSLGSFLFMGLIGLILASVVNIFIGSGPMDFVISIVGLLIFMGLTAFDTQKILNDRRYSKYPVLGALTLYLDFINMFLYILKIFGNKK